jgi:hypothetical protein
VPGHIRRFVKREQVEDLYLYFKGGKLIEDVGNEVNIQKRKQGNSVSIISRRMSRLGLALFQVIGIRKD